jgi:hypothetical protein
MLVPNSCPIYVGERRRTIKVKYAQFFNVFNIRYRPLQYAKVALSLFHGENRGSSPLGSASLFNYLELSQAPEILFVWQIYGMSGPERW